MAELVITELRRTGSGVEPTLVSFRWSSATHSSMTNPLSSELKVVTSRRTPAGAEEPVEQVMSVSWEPFPVEGEWNDKWAGVGFAASMLREFPRLVGRTPLVRLQLDEQSYVGLITNFKPNYITRDRIGYSFTMSPHRNEYVGSFRLSENKVPPQPINSRVDRATEDLELLVDQFDLVDDLPVKNFDIDEASASVSEVSAAVDKVSAANSLTLATSINSPTDRTATVTDAVERAQQLGRNLLVMATAFRRVRGSVQTVMDSVARQRSDLTVAFDDAISILRFNEWRTGVMRRAAQSLGTSTAAETDMRALATRRPRAIHYVVAGESLERISLRYYGTADNWRAIYDANNLDTLLLDGGEKLLIPERTS